MQRKKHIRWLIILVLLLAAWLGLLSYQPDPGTEQPRSGYAIPGTAPIVSIRLESPGQQVFLRWRNQLWLLNDSLQADAQLVDLLLKIANQLQVRRPVPRDILPTIDSIFEKAGVVAEFYDEQGLVESYEVAGIPAGRVTYVRRKNETPQEVFIQGYNSHLAAMYQLPLNQWRNKVVFSSNDRTIKTLTLDYLDSNRQDLTIRSGSGFPQVESLGGIDSLRLFDYISQFNYFEAAGIIQSGEYARFDSLMAQTEPIATLAIEDIDQRFNNRLELYPHIPGDAFRLARTKAGDWMVFEEKIIQQVLVSPDFFAPKVQ
jgi:hypothetical protein